MRSTLIALAVTALAAGMVVAPVTHQTAKAQIYSGLESGGSIPANGDVILVRKGGGHGGGHGHGGFRGGGGHGFKGAMRGGGHGFKGHRGGGRHVYRGGGPRHAYRGRHYAKNWHHDGKGHHGKHYKRYAYRGRYYRGRYYDNYWWYGPGIYVGAYAYGYGGCAWLRQQAIITGSSYWWDRYYDCIGYY